MTYLVIITLHLLFSDDTIRVEQYQRYEESPSWEECVAKKHQLEFLPPVGLNTAQVYFCVKDEE